MKARYHYENIGVNSRLDTIQAAILRVKLQYLTQFNKSRSEAADQYDKGLLGCESVSVPFRADYSSHIFHQYTIRVKNRKRDELKNYLLSKGIPTMIYYPGPLHMQPAYRYLGFDENHFPVTSDLCREVLSLPMHPDLEQEQIDHIVLNIRKFFDN
jgi:dTDP-4-amino-4,6-dideoxygalactose transaminase